MSPLLKWRKPAGRPWGAAPPVAGAAPFTTLARTFFAQFFTSESVVSDIQLRQTFVWVLAFLLVPGVFLLVQVFPSYQIGAAIAIARHKPEIIESQLAQITLMLVTYSMVTIGIVAMFVWDKLVFDRRDAMVLGVLPLGPMTIVGAKLAALAALLLGGSITVNLITAIPFSLTTTLRLSVLTLIGHFAVCLVANVVAAAFVFCALVTIRGLLALLVPERAAAQLGALLQFLFVASLLCFVVVLLDFGVQAEPSSVFVAGSGAWMPTAWFLGLFEWLLGSTRPAFTVLGHRALLATALALAGAAFVSVAGFRRQMQRALSAPAATGPAGTARVSRTVARWLVGRNSAARGTADFLLLTIARNRSQQALIAVNVAIGVAGVAAVFATHVHSLASLRHPRTATLWIPLLVAYWTTVGLRGAFFVPSELRAAWTFRFHGPEPEPGYWSAVRAAMVAFTLPPVIALTFILLVPLIGWRVAAWHALIVAALTILLIEIVALTIDFIPFTRAYQSGHAKLKTRWWLYLLGMFAFAELPVRIELRLLGNPVRLVGLIEMTAWIVAAIAVVEWVGRRRAHRWFMRPSDEEAGEPSELTILDLTGALPTGVR